jgi:hypothetical protein
VLSMRCNKWVDFFVPLVYSEYFIFLEKICMQKAIKISLAVASIVVLAACGGGDETPANPISKYVGTYYMECGRGEGESSQVSIKVNDLGAGNFAFQQSIKTFNDGACSGDGQSADMGSGAITVLGTEKLKFSNFEDVLPPSICATKNEEVSFDLVRVSSNLSTTLPDVYFYKIDSYFFVMLKDPVSNLLSGSVSSTDRNFSTDSFIDCSAPPA